MFTLIQFQLIILQRHVQHYCNECKKPILWGLTDFSVTSLAIIMELLRVILTAICTSILNTDTMNLNSSTLHRCEVLLCRTIVALSHIYLCNDVWKESCTKPFKHRSIWYIYYTVAFVIHFKHLVHINGILSIFLLNVVI